MFELQRTEETVGWKSRASLKILRQHFPEYVEENRHLPVVVAGITASVLTGHIPNTRQKIIFSPPFFLKFICYESL
jgi:hypothetical protein